MIGKAGGIWNRLGKRPPQGASPEAMQVSLSKQVFKIIIWFQVVCLCRLCSIVDDRAGFGACNCIDHDPVLFLMPGEVPSGLFVVLVVGNTNSDKEKSDKLGDTIEAAFVEAQEWLKCPEKYVSISLLWLF